ncbi:MAG: glycosyltransferase involved in cell wall biosynthesis [Lysobacterales bacterium]|jgi:glycosyltransferase involved in cell wall biosynthesis
MKVLHVGKFFAPFRGGVENYMRDAMVSLARQGVRCFAVVHQHQWSFRSTDDLLDESASRIHIIRAGTWFKFMYTPFSPMFPVLLRRFIRLHQPDVLHLHMPNPSAFWVLLLKPAFRIPWVVHWHADVVASTHDPRLRWFYHLYRPLEQRLLRQAKAIVVTSQAYLDFSKPLKDHKNKCQVVPLGLDPGHHPARIQDTQMNPAKNLERFHILAIGRLTYYKGFEYLIQAAVHLANVKIEIVGSGDQRKALEALLNKLGVQDKVSLLGSLSDEELQKRLEHCDCLCLPSIERTEAFGMVLLEAMLHGKPVVVSDVAGSGMGWIVEQGNTGLLVKPSDVDSLTEALKYLQLNPVETQAMGQRGRIRFDEMFQIEKSTISLIGIYERVTTADTKNKA